MALVKLSGERKPTEHAVRILTYDDYCKAWPNDHKVSPILVLATGRNAGVYCEVRWNGQPKTWKTRPGMVERPVKYGMYECFHVGTVDGLARAYTLAD